MYILVIKRKGQREEEGKIPAVLADGLLGWFGLLQLPCVALLLFLDALSKPSTVTSPPFPWELHFGRDQLCAASWFKLLSEICQRFGMLGHFVASLWLITYPKPAQFGAFMERQGLLLTSLFVYRANSKSH